MRKYLLSLFVALCSVTLFAAKADKQVVVLSCDLHCQGCCDKIMKNIVCDLKTKTVTVTYDANKTDVPTLLKAFDKIGKPAKVKEAPAQKEASAPTRETDATTGASQQY